jgi:hypothetical protein
VRRGRKATGLRREDSRAAEGNAQAFFLQSGFLFFRLQRATASPGKKKAAQNCVSDRQVSRSK